MSSSKMIPVFHPTMDEFTTDFSEYLSRIYPIGKDYGLVKIIPPDDWNNQKDGWFDNTIKRLSIPAPISQYVSGMTGIFQQTNIIDKPMKITKFRSLAEDALESRVPASSDEEIERRFWKNIRFEPPIYGADMKGSLFPKDLFHWNVSRLTEQNLLKYLGIDVDGVNSPYLYFGMWKAMFSWHTEDMDLFSINYNHYGEPKRWYVIPEKERNRFEQFCISHFPELYKQCKQFLRHKTTMISPSVLKSANISVYTGIQREREFIITFPGAYHAGFNHGFNCAESLNFAIDPWVNFGLKAKICYCKPDNVSIDMKVFLQNYKLITKKEFKYNEDKYNNIQDDAPAFVYDHFESKDDYEEEHISIKIPIPGLKKTIKKKSTKKKKSLRGKKDKSLIGSSVSSKNSQIQSSCISFSKLKDLSDDKIPSSILPKSLINSYTS